MAITYISSTTSFVISFLNNGTARVLMAVEPETLRPSEHLPGALKYDT